MTDSVTDANLKSIEVTPTTASITSGETQQFVDTATLDDGSAVVITAVVTWKSTNRSVATISSGGLATGQRLAAVRKHTAQRLQEASRAIPRS